MRSAAARRSTGNARGDQRQGRYRRGESSRGSSHCDQRRSHRCHRERRRDQALRRNGHPGHRRGRAARHPRVRREPRSLHGCRRGTAGAEAGDREDVGRHPRDGRQRRQGRQTRSVDLRPRLASGEMDGAAFAECGRVPDRSVAQQGVAEQSRATHARERPRELCQRAGDEAVGRLTCDQEPGGRRDPERREGQPDGPSPRDRLSPDQARHRGAGTDRRRTRGA